MARNKKREHNKKGLFLSRNSTATMVLYSVAIREEKFTKQYIFFRDFRNLVIVGQLYTEERTKEF